MMVAEAKLDRIDELKDEIAERFERIDELMEEVEELVDDD